MSGRVQMHGPLYKRSSKSLRWKLLYGELHDDHRLMLYQLTKGNDGEGDSRKMVESVDLPPTGAVQSSTGGSFDHMFALALKTHVIILAAETLEDKQNWISALKRSIEDARRQSLAISPRTDRQPHAHSNPFMSASPTWREGSSPPSSARPHHRQGRDDGGKRHGGGVGFKGALGGLAKGVEGLRRLVTDSAGSSRGGDSGKDGDGSHLPIDMLQSGVSPSLSTASVPVAATNSSLTRPLLPQGPQPLGRFLFGKAPSFGSPSASLPALPDGSPSSTSSQFTESPPRKGAGGPFASLGVLSPQRWASQCDVRGERPDTARVEGAGAAEGEGDGGVTCRDGEGGQKHTHGKGLLPPMPEFTPPRPSPDARTPAKLMIAQTKPNLRDSFTSMDGDDLSVWEIERGLLEAEVANLRQRAADMKNRIRELETLSNDAAQEGTDGVEGRQVDVLSAGDELSQLRAQHQGVLDQLAEAQAHRDAHEAAMTKMQKEFEGAIEEHGRELATIKATREASEDHLKAQIKTLKQERTQSEKRLKHGIRELQDRYDDAVNELQRIRAQLDAVQQEKTILQNQLQHEVHQLQQTLASRPELASAVTQTTGAADGEGVSGGGDHGEEFERLREQLAAAEARHLEQLRKTERDEAVLAKQIESLEAERAKLQTRLELVLGGGDQDQELKVQIEDLRHKKQQTEEELQTVIDALTEKTHALEDQVRHLQSGPTDRERLLAEQLAQVTNENTDLYNTLYEQNNRSASAAAATAAGLVGVAAETQTDLIHQSTQVGIMMSGSRDAQVQTFQPPSARSIAQYSPPTPHRNTLYPGFRLPPTYPASTAAAAASATINTAARRVPSGQSNTTPSTRPSMVEDQEDSEWEKVDLVTATMPTMVTGMAEQKEGLKGGEKTERGGLSGGYGGGEMNIHRIKDRLEETIAMEKALLHQLDRTRDSIRTLRSELKWRRRGGIMFGEDSSLLFSNAQPILTSALPCAGEQRTSRSHSQSMQPHASEEHIAGPSTGSGGDAAGCRPGRASFGGQRGDHGSLEEEQEEI
ncbi:unnamed protein product [Vitrella brassicaformis CCMP3155]|uniref:PH domain-containing protein n=3 Tax=Vitrella brassicaformis TaxID=1169539 RepID=A0A0G4EHC8_VITBC|nr:unnamed protein product [Vitrella brassicaformis CCMP3155]|eukprot:CEL95579.1 unnamed protein product [Vitrella brassicaformis CCMP3155]